MDSPEQRESDLIGFGGVLHKTLTDLCLHPETDQAQYRNGYKDHNGCGSKFRSIEEYLHDIQQGECKGKAKSKDVIDHKLGKAVYDLDPAGKITGRELSEKIGREMKQPCHNSSFQRYRDPDLQTSYRQFLDGADHSGGCQSGNKEDRRANISRDRLPFQHIAGHIL